jgi:hypothetical protein
VVDPARKAFSEPNGSRSSSVVCGSDSDTSGAGFAGIAGVFWCLGVAHALLGAFAYIFFLFLKLGDTRHNIHLFER